MSLDLWEDVDRWEVFYLPPPGTEFYKAAALVLEKRKHNSKVSGFLFNGKILRMQEDDTADSLYASKIRKGLTWPVF